MISATGSHDLPKFVGGENADLDDLSLDQIKRLFRDFGIVFFRGFGIDAMRMKLFADQFATRFNRDQSRPAVPGTDGAVYWVTEGNGAVEPHCEQANSPFRPDAILFCCSVPAESGGETLVWDGIKAWQLLRPETRDFLLQNRLRFFQRYPAGRWRSFLGEASTRADLETTLHGHDGLSYFVGDDESLYLEYLCSPAFATRYGGQLAFANSLLLEYRTLRDRHAGTQDQVLAFENGEPIDEELVNELHTALSEITRTIHWQAGDLVMIDNSRFLHGRTPFNDQKRELFSCCCFLNF